jgi:menaquinol-cytochrome c reductase iron-sulfur subunit
MAKSAHLDRNTFVKGTVGLLGTTMAAVIGVPAIIYVISPSFRAGKNDVWIPLGKIESFPIGVPTLVNFTRSVVNGWEKTVLSYGVYVYRKSETETDTVTYSNVCTHLGCRVNWTPEENIFHCPCHNAAFNIDGEVVDGPPPKPMYTYENKVENGELSIRYEEF